MRSFEEEDWYNFQVGYAPPSATFHLSPNENRSEEETSTQQRRNVIYRSAILVY